MRSLAQSSHPKNLERPSAINDPENLPNDPVGRCSLFGRWTAMHLSGNQRRRRFGIGRGFVLALVIVTTGCTADYGKLSAADEASSCAAWLTGNAPLEAPPRVMLVDEPLVVSSQNTVGVAYESLNLVKVQRGTAEQTAARIVHEMAHLYGATEDQADFAERNTWRCALG